MSLIAITPKATEMPEMPAKPDDLLTQILQTKRSHGSPGDTNFRLWLAAKLKALGYAPAFLAEGCMFVTTDPKSDTLFSAHIDTCHSKENSTGAMQEIAYDPNLAHIFLPNGSTSTCLGADDGAGIYLLLKLLEAKVPGGYLFATGEEVGGVGCRAVLAKHRDILENYSRAVAFDRADNFEVIVTQGGRQCASPQAGAELANALSKQGLNYEVSHRGSFTDTKVYADVIDECFNIGVGYYDQHTPNERQDVHHLETLLSVILTLKWDELKVYRKPAPDTPNRAQLPKFAPLPKFNQSFADFEKEYYGAESKKLKPMPMPKSVNPPKTVQTSVTGIVLDEMPSYSSAEYMALVEDDPEIATSVMMYLFARNQALQSEISSLNMMLGID